MITPRTWQAEFALDFESSREKIYALEATPRSGKTFAAIWAYLLGKEEEYDKVVIVGPTDAIREQWVEAAPQATDGKVQLCPIKNFSAQLNPFDGVSMTYHQIATNKRQIKNYCRMFRTLVVLDEPHHLADKKSWGVAAQAAFENAVRILSITGTPFRSDEYKIPFMRYENGVLRCDYSYGYSQAVADGVCRELKFFPIGGQVKWQHRREDVEKIETVEYEASTSDDLGGDQVLINQRLRAALDPRKGLLPYIAEQAHGKLIETRHAGHKNAAGLAVCYDIPHAKKVAALLERITGKKPVLVTSLDDDSKLKIERFRKSKDFWIVSVQMISEGVDIRRLRVLLFATNIKTAMGFRQLTARVGTIDGKHDGEGYVYLPEDPDLLEHVRQMESEIRHEVGDDLPMFSKKKELPEKTFKYILETLESKVRGVVAVDASKAEKKEVLTASLAKQMERLRQDITGLAVDLARLNGQSSPQKVHAAWMQRGGKPQAQETVEGLRAKYLWLRQLVNIARQRKFYTQREKVF